MADTMPYEIATTCLLKSGLMHAWLKDFGLIRVDQGEFLSTACTFNRLPNLADIRSVVIRRMEDAGMDDIPAYWKVEQYNRAELILLYMEMHGQGQ